MSAETAVISSLTAALRFPQSRLLLGRRRGSNAVPDARAMFQDALRHQRAGRIAEAVARYQGALRLKPDLAEGHNNLGVALAAQGRIKEAIAHHKYAAALRPDDVCAHYNLAVALAEQGSLEEAVARYKRVVFLKPD